jgi:hypothetical protein
MAVRLFVSKMDGAIFSFLGGFVQRFLNKDSLLQSNMTFAYHSGYLSDPY